MSLQVWLPLNGSLNNQGLSDVAVTNNGATVDSNGKIGSCYSFNTGKYLTVTRPIAIAKEISYSCWVRLSSWNESFDCIISMETGTEWKNNRATLCRDGSSTHLTWNIANGSSNSRISSNTSLSLNTWYHIACTYDGAKLRIYVNGVEDNSADTSLIPNYDSANLYIGASSINTQHLNGCLNDVRIYDHCLSAKEVKEISKGLVCHYKLSNLYETGRGNKYGGTVASGAMRHINSKFTMTALENERGYNYKFTYTGNGDDSWSSMNAGNYSFTAGKRYYYSCKVRCHSANFSMQLRASRSDNDWVTNMTNVIDSSLADGKWHEYVVSQVVNSTYDRVGETITCNPILEFYTESLSTSGKVYSADFDMKDVQVIESDWYVPFTDGSMANAEVTDCSGLGNNGTAVGNVAYKNSSVRYESCYDFDGDTGCIQIPNLSTLVPSGEFTMNCWIYHDDTWSSKEYETIFGGPAGFELEAKNKATNSPVLRAHSWGGVQVTYELNKWNMITMTRNASETKFYINGELKITGSAGTIPSGNYFVGAWRTSSEQNYKGKISDFRLYSVVLSEEDIKTLYNISASVDKNGNMYAYEFKEE